MTAGRLHYTILDTQSVLWRKVKEIFRFSKKALGFLSGFFIAFGNKPHGMICMGAGRI